MIPLTTRFRGLWRRLTGKPPLVLYQQVNGDPPSATKPNILYAVLEESDPWQAAMICPCGCNEFIHLSLLPNDRPRWRLVRNVDGTASLHPSVWRTTGCRSHFILRNGEITWCHEND